MSIEIEESNISSVEQEKTPQEGVEEEESIESKIEQVTEELSMNTGELMQNLDALPEGDELPDTEVMQEKINEVGQELEKDELLAKFLEAKESITSDSELYSEELKRNPPLTSFKDWINNVGLSVAAGAVYGISQNIGFLDRFSGMENVLKTSAVAGGVVAVATLAYYAGGHKLVDYLKVKGYKWGGVAVAGAVYGAEKLAEKIKGNNKEENPEVVDVEETEEDAKSLEQQDVNNP